MQRQPSEEPSKECDLLVVGSGAAGLSAAVTAAVLGQRVILVEKEPVVGGTTAWSGGWIWAPGNPVARRAGKVEDADAPRRYLQAVLGADFKAGRVDAFLAAAPEMLEFFEQCTSLSFEGGLAIPDTYGHQPGAGTGGRSVIAAPYDGRALGAAIRMLRRPLPETSFMGMTIQSGEDLRAFMTVTRSGCSFLHVARRFARHLWDLARHGRGMQLRNGNALAARLLRSALDAGIDIMTETTVASLTRGTDGVTGAILSRDGRTMPVTAHRGVVLACGGFGHDAARRASVLPAKDDHLTLAVPSATGDGLRLGESVGGEVDTTLAQAVAYCPVSEVPYADGSVGRFPHIIDRGKPGVIGVLKDGRRFCNEGLGYHDYVLAMRSAVPDGDEVASWLVCSHRFLRRYGLGIVRPAPLPIRPWLRSGYLKRGRTIPDLAQVCGIDAEGLAHTVERFNADASEGKDREFGRGETPYMRLQGDPEIAPNPCVALIDPGPFYAVKVRAGGFGTFAGLRTDSKARVLDGAGAPVRGLYAAGTDMASVMGGHYPAGGINLGPALTFGFIAGRHAAEGIDN